MGQNIIIIIIIKFAFERYLITQERSEELERKAIEMYHGACSESMCL